MIPQLPQGHAIRIDPDTGAPTLVKVQRDEPRPHISMEQALQQAQDDAARESDDYQAAGQWLRTRSPRQQMLELYQRIRALEKMMEIDR